MKGSKKIVIFFLIIISLPIIVNYTLSKYTTSITGDATSSIAKFIVKGETQENFELNISEIDSEESVNYDFYVSNYDENGRSEVSTQYSLSIQNEFCNLPLKYELYKNDEKVNILNSSNMYTDELLFSTNTKTKYTLNISIDDDSYIYQNLIDNVLIELNSVQVD